MIPPASGVHSRHGHAATLLTEEQYLELPDEPGKRELIDGELVECPPAKSYHSVLAMRLVRCLQAGVDPSQLLIEAAYQLRQSRWLIPDISVRWPNQLAGGGWFQGSPMLAVEIVSRGNTAVEIDRKVALYLEHGAAEVWILYPKTNSMLVFRPDSTERIADGRDYRFELLGVTIPSAERAPTS